MSVTIRAGSLAAGFVYFALVFTVGFLFGAVRVLVLEPVVGATLATLAEAPVILSASFISSQRVADWFHLGQERPSLVVMGLSALALVVAVDVTVGLSLRAIPLGEQMLHLLTPAGSVYLSLLVCFALMPLFRGIWRRR